MWLWFTYRMLVALRLASEQSTGEPWTGAPSTVRPPGELPTGEPATGKLSTGGPSTGDRRLLVHRKAVGCPPVNRLPGANLNQRTA